MKDMRKSGIPDAAFSVPNDSSGGNGEAIDIKSIATLPRGKAHEYVFGVSEIIRKQLAYSPEGQRKYEAAFVKRLFDRFLEYSTIFNANRPDLPRNLFAIRSVWRSLENSLRPIYEKEAEIVDTLRTSTKRAWDDRSPLKRREGALLTRTQRQKIQEVKDSFNVKGWQTYAEAAQSAGITDAKQVPPSIDYLFLAYVIAVRDFYRGPREEQLQLLDQCAHKMLANEPQDDGVRKGLVQQFGDATKSLLNLLTGKGPGVTPERTELWLKAGRKFGSSL